MVFPKVKQKSIERARIRTWNLLIRSQTRYPLRHTPLHIVADVYKQSAQSKNHISIFKAINSLEINNQIPVLGTKISISRPWFRSTDLWVMGPARFHCASLLLFKSGLRTYKMLHTIIFKSIQSKFIWPTPMLDLAIAQLVERRTVEEHCYP